MAKDTVKTGLQKSFSGLIWRIEVDTAKSLLAIESRDIDTGTPKFAVVDYESGITLFEERAYGDRLWTIGGVFGGYVILRNYGEHSPENAGIICINVSDGNVVWEHFGWTFLELRQHTLVVRPRSVLAGYETYVNIANGAEITKPIDNPPIYNDVAIPSVHIDSFPSILKNYDVEGDIFTAHWLEKKIWAFHHRQNGTLDVKMLISNAFMILDEYTVMAGLNKKLPELFFMINNQIFFIRGNKREIVSYLV